MDITLLEELINQFGFPIIMVGYFIWDKSKNTKQFLEVIEDLKDTLSHNTTILEKLLTKLNMDGEKNWTTKF